MLRLIRLTVIVGGPPDSADANSCTVAAQNRAGKKNDNCTDPKNHEERMKDNCDEHLASAAVQDDRKH